MDQRLDRYTSLWLVHIVPALVMTLQRSRRMWTR